jgi:hypothetical protein
MTHGAEVICLGAVSHGAEIPNLAAALTWLRYQRRVRRHRSRRRACIYTRRPLPLLLSLAGRAAAGALLRPPLHCTGRPSSGHPFAALAAPPLAHRSLVPAAPARALAARAPLPGLLRPTAAQAPARPQAGARPPPPGPPVRFFN